MKYIIKNGKCYTKAFLEAMSTRVQRRCGSYVAGATHYTTLSLPEIAKLLEQARV